MISLLVALIPAFALFACLALGRYPGGEILVRAASRPPKARRTRERVPSISLFGEVAVPSGGALVARSLAGRAPPAGATTHSH